MILNTPGKGNPSEIRTSYRCDRSDGDCGKVRDVLEWAIPSWKDMARGERKQNGAQYTWMANSGSFISLQTIKNVLAKTVPGTEIVPSKGGEIQRPLHTILNELGFFFQDSGYSGVTYIILKSEQRSEVEEASDLRAIHENFGINLGNNNFKVRESERQKTKSPRCFVFTATRAGFDVGSILPAVEALQSGKSINGPEGGYGVPVPI